MNIYIIISVTTYSLDASKPEEDSATSREMPMIPGLSSKYNQKKINVAKSNSTFSEIPGLKKADFMSNPENVTYYTKDGKIILWHWTGTKNNKEIIANIKKYGLLSYAEQLHRGIKENRTKCLPDQDDVIYFRPMPAKGIPANKYVCITVDPKSISIYNQELRAAENQNYYNTSKMSLEQYLTYKKQAEQLQKTLKPEQFVAFQINGSPYVKALSASKNGYQDYYIPEVIIHRSVISPEELLFPGDKPLDAYTAIIES